MPKVRTANIPAGTTQFVIDDDNSYSLAKGATRTSTDTDWTILLDATSSGAKLAIAGKVGQTGTHVDIYKDASIGIQGTDATIEIAKTGSITGYRGVYVTDDAANAKITNKGTIDAKFEGIAAFGEGATISNSGKVIGVTGANSHAIYTYGDASKITNSGVIVAAEFGIFSAGNAGAVTNTGKVTTGGTAIQSAGTGGRVVNKGILIADEGIYASGSNSTVINNGKIVANSDIKEGIGASKENAVIVNNGTIIGMNDGILSWGPGAQITNNGKIAIHDLGAGIFIGVNNTTTTTIVNNGTITTETGSVIDASLSPGGVNLTNKGRIESSENGYFDRAVELGAGNDIIVNKGIMIGKIELGGGNDSFDNRGGKIDSSVIGGLGDDTLIVDSAKTKLIELADGGSDTVKSTVSYVLSDHVENLTLLGKGKINATGNAENNMLTGNGGDNTLKGLAGADTFVFATGGGHDTIADFAAGTDKIDLSGWVFTDFEDLMNDPKTIEKNGNLVITSGKDQLIIVGVVKDDLDAGDFVF